MKELASKLANLLIILMACFALGVTAVGCGDDSGGDDPDTRAFNTPVHPAAKLVHP